MDSMKLFSHIIHGLFLHETQNSVEGSKQFDTVFSLCKINGY